MKNQTFPLSRREFSALAVGAPFLLNGRKLDSQAAHITLNPDRVIGQIDPKLYGNFLEHLGRCIQGGVFEENSPFSDSEGFRRDVLKAVEGLSVPLLPTGMTSIPRRSPIKETAAQVHSPRRR
jgi:hypothetical protein